MAQKKVYSPSDARPDAVNEYMNALEHPLKAEWAAVREIILGANANISERIKWNAPSFFYKEDLATFHTRNPAAVHIVFHHPAIVSIQSGLLEGDYKDRRMLYLRTMDDVQAHKQELASIINELIHRIDTAVPGQ